MGNPSFLPTCDNLGTSCNLEETQLFWSIKWVYCYLPEGRRENAIRSCIGRHFGNRKRQNCILAIINYSLTLHLELFLELKQVLPAWGRCWFVRGLVAACEPQLPGALGPVDLWLDGTSSLAVPCRAPARERISGLVRLWTQENTVSRMSQSLCTQRTMSASKWAPATSALIS